jgi:hypothetical protein
VPTSIVHSMLRVAARRAVLARRSFSSATSVWEAPFLGGRVRVGDVVVGAVSALVLTGWYYMWQTGGDRDTGEVIACLPQVGSEEQVKRQEALDKIALLVARGRLSPASSLEALLVLLRGSSRNGRHEAASIAALKAQKLLSEAYSKGEAGTPPLAALQAQVADGCISLMLQQEVLARASEGPEDQREARVRAAATGSAGLSLLAWHVAGELQSVALEDRVEPAERARRFALYRLALAVAEAAVETRSVAQRRLGEGDPSELTAETVHKAVVLAERLQTMHEVPTVKSESVGLQFALGLRSTLNDAEEPFLALIPRRLTATEVMFEQSQVWWQRA